MLCKWIGHKPAMIVVITGFRNSDGAAISRCLRCECPVVIATVKASGELLADLKALAEEAEQARK